MAFLALKNVISAFQASLAGVPDDERELILGGNMVRVYGLQELFADHATEMATV